MPRARVNSQKDLEGILTLGFRGEALASIAAVARVELLTRVGDALEGTRYVISGGEEESCEPAGCPAGTTIVVRDLFLQHACPHEIPEKGCGRGQRCRLRPR